MATAFGHVMEFMLPMVFLSLAAATCLPGGIPAENRVNIEGLNGAAPAPFGLYTGDWESANLSTFVVKILAEERLGYKSIVSGVGVSSDTSIFATAGCLAPNELATDPQCSANPAFVHHASLEVWGLAAVAGAQQRLAHIPEVLPEDAGAQGYLGIEGIHVKAQQLNEAYQGQGLPLEYYRSYDVRWNRPADYFDNYTAIDRAELKPCSDTALFQSSKIEAYLRVSSDNDGVTQKPDGTLAARCWDDSWWFSPACRSNPETCIPWVSAGDGWGLDEAMQKAAAWGMPVAIAVATNLASWKSISRSKRILFYWWQPDSSFVDLGPVLLTFPPFNPAQRAQGDFTSSSDNTRISKWLHNQIGVRAPRLRQLVKRVSIDEVAMNEMLLDLKQQQGRATQEEVACKWLKNNEQVWRGWIPDMTECTPGKGLIGIDGSFVTSRANGTDCDWCRPGMSSTMLADTAGTTYVCERCGPGTSQLNPGQLQCDPCSTGTFAAGYESRECQRCDLGTYVSQEGQLTCHPCPAGFITNYKGAISVDACICPAGSYRDADRRGECLPCVEGMTCPEGSDARGYSRQHAAQHPIVPLLKPGFWANAEQPLSVFHCDNTERCPGGTVPGSACAEGFQEQACAACRPDYAPSFGEACQPCATGAIRIILFPVLPLALVTAVVAVLYHSSGGPYSRWDTWTKGVQSTIFILLNHYHVVNIIGALIAQRSLSTTLQSIRVMSDIMSVFMPQCAGISSFAAQLVLNSHGPGFLMLVYMFLWLMSQLIGHFKPKFRLDRNRLMNSYMSLILTFFTAVVDMVLTIFKCRSNPSGVYTVVRDMSVECYDEGWNQLVIVGVLAILFWCIGYGAALSRAIYVSPLRFHDAAFRTRWTFLFVRYRPDAHFWAMVIVARGALLNMRSLFIQSVVGQIYWVMFILSLYTFLIIGFRPWRQLLNNLMDGFVQINLSVTCALCLFLVRDSMESFSADTDLVVNLTKANMAIVAVPAMPIVLLMMWRDWSVRAKEQKDLESRLILSSLQLMFEGEVEDQLDFLKHLTERDFWILSEAKTLLLMELGHKKVRRGYSAMQLTMMKKNEEDMRTSSAELKRIFSSRSSTTSFNKKDSSVIDDDFVTVEPKEESNVNASEQPKLKAGMEIEDMFAGSGPEENGADVGECPGPPAYNDEMSDHFTV